MYMYVCVGTNRIKLVHILLSLCVFCPHSSVYEHLLEKHLKKCNAAKKQIPVSEYMYMNNDTCSISMQLSLL